MKRILSMTAARAAAGLVLASCSALAGCGGYVLRGSVVEGFAPDIRIVADATASRSAQGSGVEGVRLSVYRDPGRLNQQLIATGTTAADGTFAIPISAFGAGWMEEQWLIEARRAGYLDVQSVLTLPAGSQRLIITTAPGAPGPARRDGDLMDEYERFRWE
jgi:hypothetical protein